MIKASLLLLLKGDQILLAMKKRGFGVNKWNGVGGKQNKDESIEETCIRECREEIGIDVLEIKKVAILKFYNDGPIENNQEVHVYTSKGWEGEPIESEEMAPKWFKINEIPYKNMWDDDPYWLPLVLKGEFVTGDFWFNQDNEMLRHKIESKKLDS